MTIPEWLSVIAIVISSGGLFIQVRNWATSKPRLVLSVMAEALAFPDDGKGTRAALTVVNRGNAPTEITHMVGFIYDSWWKKARNKPSFSGIVTSTSVPSRIEPFGRWFGQMNYDDKLRNAMKDGKLYLGVHASHSDKLFLVKVVPPKAKNLPKNKINNDNT